MSAPAYFQWAEDYAAYRPVKQVSIEEGIELVGRAIEFARDNRVSQLLVDTRQLSGFAPPGTWERFWMGTRFAIAADSIVKIALVARPEMIDPNRYGVKVARERGAQADVFDCEDDAMVWLKSSGAK